MLQKVLLIDKHLSIMLLNIIINYFLVDIFYLKNFFYKYDIFDDNWMIMIVFSLFYLLIENK